MITSWIHSNVSMTPWHKNAAFICGSYRYYRFLIHEHHFITFQVLTDSLLSCTNEERLSNHNLATATTWQVGVVMDFGGLYRFINFPKPPQQKKKESI